MKADRWRMKGTIRCDTVRVAFSLDETWVLLVRSHVVHGVSNSNLREKFDKVLDFNVCVLRHKWGNA